MWVRLRLRLWELSLLHRKSIAVTMRLCLLTLTLTMSIKKAPDTGEQSEWDKKTESLHQEQFDSESFCPASPSVDRKSLDHVCLNLRTPGNLECSREKEPGERRLAA